MDTIAAYEDELLRYATDKLNAIDGMRIFGQAAHKGAVLSFLVGNIHHYDMGMLLGSFGDCGPARTSARPAVDAGFGNRGDGSRLFLVL